MLVFIIHCNSFLLISNVFGFVSLFFRFRYLAGVSFLIYRLPFVECLMFGALISATDPVTVLSIFQVM